MIILMTVLFIDNGNDYVVETLNCQRGHVVENSWPEGMKKAGRKKAGRM
jgi:hypothetical protein